MSTLTVQTISNGTVSTSSENVIRGSARAWVNFDGTNSSIRSAYNVASITKNGTGDYNINFTNAMPNNLYSASGICMGGGGSNNQGQFISAPQTTSGTSASSLRIQVRFSTNNALNDVDTISVQVFA